MSYLVTATRGVTAFAGSSSTASKAMEWIRSRRAVGADNFVVVDGEDRYINEDTLADRARLEPQVPRPVAH
jgi:hypothetical protein